MSRSVDEGGNLFGETTTTDANKVTKLTKKSTSVRKNTKWGLFSLSLFCLSLFCLSLHFLNVQNRFVLSYFGREKKVILYLVATVFLVLTRSVSL